MPSIPCTFVHSGLDCLCCSSHFSSMALTVEFHGRNRQSTGHSKRLQHSLNSLYIRNSNTLQTTRKRRLYLCLREEECNDEENYRKANRTIGMDIHSMYLVHRDGERNKNRGWYFVRLMWYNHYVDDGERSRFMSKRFWSVFMHFRSFRCCSCWQGMALFVLCTLILIEKWARSFSRGISSMSNSSKFCFCHLPLRLIIYRLCEWECVCRYVWLNTNCLFRREHFSIHLFSAWRRCPLWHWFDIK